MALSSSMLHFDWHSLQSAETQRASSLRQGRLALKPPMRRATQSCSGLHPCLSTMSRTQCFRRAKVSIDLTSYCAHTDSAWGRRVDRAVTLELGRTSRQRQNGRTRLRAVLFAAACDNGYTLPFVLEYGDDPRWLSRPGSPRRHLQPALLLRSVNGQEHGSHAGRFRLLDQLRRWSMHRLQGRGSRAAP